MGFLDISMRMSYWNFIKNDIYFSTERGNGWAIPVMNSIVLGKIPVVLDWGASTEYHKNQ